MTIIAATIAAGFVLATTSLASAGTVAVKSKTVEYKIGNQTFEGLFVYPQVSKGKVPGVLLVHNWLGISDETRSRRSAWRGWALLCLAVDVYGKGFALTRRKKQWRWRANTRATASFSANACSGDWKSCANKRRRWQRGGCRRLLFRGTGVIELARAGR